MRGPPHPERPGGLAPTSGDPFARPWRIGRATWPQLDLARHDFGRWLRARLAPGQELGALWTSDLFLVCACLLGVAGADRAFRQRLERDVDRHLRRLVPSAGRRVMLQDELAAQLLAARPRGDAPHLSDYSGRSPLTLWLRLVALRRALSAAARARPPTGVPPPKVDLGPGAMLTTRPNLRSVGSALSPSWSSRSKVS